VNTSNTLDVDVSINRNVTAKDNILNDEDRVVYGRDDLLGLVWCNKYLKIRQSHLNIADHIIVNVYSCFLESLGKNKLLDI